MSQRLQTTQLQRSLGDWWGRLQRWADNPWRRASLLLILMLASFLIGSSVGSIAGASALMDPVAALITVAFWELLVRIRRPWPKRTETLLGLQMIDMMRIGLLYGLLLEGFKLL
ncbi:DUF565 domain-containing protein [Synechococcus sp. MIT S9451]|uniref:DUF565 domain-containing protein n=1 Tax=Synechococcus sp. MIT S9451 TaxID=3082543 RepID=UPI0039B388DC